MTPESMAIRRRPPQQGHQAPAVLPQPNARGGDGNKRSPPRGRRPRGHRCSRRPPRGMSPPPQANAPAEVERLHASTPS
eukprot:CAMPEP_0180706262 /NCGR_PEP_ID=MMETSP1038_2-20121128/8110_1 /TAXON_ID=632150 /ORGANISM="Azadinium spinosum, Strain 3D9" /LENGTH=78 /DNA_ID=CAMNT_0022738179 /DNA_START=79 /DNA_END=315 /DNA_ORIENTATION=-